MWYTYNSSAKWFENASNMKFPCALLYVYNSRAEWMIEPFNDEFGTWMIGVVKHNELTQMWDKLIHCRPTFNVKIGYNLKAVLSGPKNTYC